MMSYDGCARIVCAVACFMMFIYVLEVQLVFNDNYNLQFLRPNKIYGKGSVALIFPSTVLDLIYFGDQALDNIARQTEPVDEVLIGLSSTKNEEEDINAIDIPTVINRFKWAVNEISPNTRVVVNYAQGWHHDTDNRHRAMMEAKSENFICFDMDDYMDKDHVKTVRKVLKNNPSLEYMLFNFQYLTKKEIVTRNEEFVNKLEKMQASQEDIDKFDATEDITFFKSQNVLESKRIADAIPTYNHDKYNCEGGWWFPEGFDGRVGHNGWPAGRVKSILEVRIPGSENGGVGCDSAFNFRTMFIDQKNFANIKNWYAGWYIRGANKENSKPFWEKAENVTDTSSKDGGENFIAANIG